MKKKKQQGACGESNRRHPTAADDVSSTCLTGRHVESAVRLKDMTKAHTQLLFSHTDMTATIIMVTVMISSSSMGKPHLRCRSIDTPRVLHLLSSLKSLTRSRGLHITNIQLGRQGDDGVGWQVWRHHRLLGIGGCFQSEEGATQCFLPRAFPGHRRPLHS